MIGRYVGWSDTIGRPHCARWLNSSSGSVTRVLSQYRFEIVPGSYGKINRRAILKTYKIIDKNPRKKELTISIHSFNSSAYRIKDDLDAIIHYLFMLECNKLYNDDATIENKFLAMLKEIDMGPLPLDEIVNHKY
jgi:hypothetical protein